VCPFGGQNDGIDSITEQEYKSSSEYWNKYLGYYSACYAGFSNEGDHRKNGASGGMATWFLEEIVSKGMVDAVICVKQNDNSGVENKFSFAICQEKEEIRQAASSKYYPVEVSNIIRYLISDSSGSTYALIGLPCLIFGIRLVMKRIPSLRSKIKILASLTCGQLPNSYYTECLSEFSGVPYQEARNLNYRYKKDCSDAGNFGFQIEGPEGVKGKIVFWDELPWLLWSNSIFTHRACKYCDDIFGETADVTFMDAWLPEYTQSADGNSIVIARTDTIRRIFDEGGIKGRCDLRYIEKGHVIRSQLGVIYKKRYLIQGWLFHAFLKREWVPLRRVRKNFMVYLKNLAGILLQSHFHSIDKSKWKEVERNHNQFLESLNWKLSLSNFVCRVEAKINRRRKRLETMWRFN